MAAGFRSGVVVGGRWLLGEQLGQGAFGQVFRTDDTSTLALGAAAVKVLHPSTSPREREAFHEEIRKVVALRHPNLVAYLDSGEHRDDDDQPHLFLVTELCRYSLQAYLARDPGRLTADQAERLLADMATGLGYLHSRGLLHRDLKPANVLLGGDDWKLGDFGLSRAMSATGHYHHGTMVMGTPRYMAPELFDDGAASAASDVYAVGVSLHQALTGRTVHEGTDVALLMQVTTQPPTIDRDLPPHWRRLIEQCLDRNPANRPGASQLPAVLAESRLKPSSRLAQLSGTSPLATHLGRPLPPPPASAATLHPSGQPSVAPPPSLPLTVPPAAVPLAAVTPVAVPPAAVPAGAGPAPVGAVAANAGPPTRDDADLHFGVPSGAWSGPGTRGPGASGVGPPGPAHTAADGGPGGPGHPSPAGGQATASVALGLSHPGTGHHADPSPGATTPPGGGGWRRVGLVAVLAVLAVAAAGVIVALAASRGSDQPTGDTSGSTVAASDATTPLSATADPAAGATADPAAQAAADPAANDTADPAARAAAAQRVAGIIAGPSDAPAGYSYNDATDTGDGEACAGVKQVRVAHPGLGVGGILYANGAGHLFVERTVVYAGVADAEAAFAYAQGIGAACDGKSYSSADSTRTWHSTPVTDLVVDGATQSTASLLRLTGGTDPDVVVITVYARLDNVLVASSGTDRGALTWYAELMIARAAYDVAPAKVEPIGAYGTVDPVPASTVRLALADPAAGAAPKVTEWLSSNDNDALDTVVAGACQALNPLITADAVPATLQKVYDDLPIGLRTPMVAVDHAQLIDLAAPTYCPAIAARLGVGQP